MTQVFNIIVFPAFLLKILTLYGDSFLVSYSKDFQIGMAGKLAESREIAAQ
jgi:hypothetical protein